MSADNTIAILETAVYPIWNVTEFRVQHCAAIGNVYRSKKFIKQYFDSAPVFDTYEEALLHAYDLEMKYAPVEHGILHIASYRKYMWEELTMGMKAKR